MIVNRDTEESYFAGLPKIFEGTFPLVAFNPARIPHVKLLQVDGFDIEIAQTLLGALDDVVVREDIADAASGRSRPKTVLGRNLRCEVDAMGCRLDDPADKLLAVSVAISQGGIDKV